MDLALHLEDLLRARDTDIVEEAEPEMIEAGPETRPGGEREPGAALLLRAD